MIFYARMFDEVEKGVREGYWAVTLRGETMDVTKVIIHWIIVPHSPGGTLPEAGLSRDSNTFCQ